MLATSAIRPARLSETMRRVRLENDSAKKNCPARRNQPSIRCQPFACVRASSMEAASSSATAGEAPSAFTPGLGWVRSSNGQTVRLIVSPIYHVIPGCAARTRVYPSLSKSATADLDAQARDPYSRRWLWIPGSRSRARNDGLSGFLKPVANAVEGFDHLEIVVHDLELLAQPFDVAVDG